MRQHFDVGPGAQNGDTTKLSNFAYITPFMAVLSALLLNEPVDRYSVIGLLLIMGGMLSDGRLRGKRICSNKTYCLTKT